MSDTEIHDHDLLPEPQPEPKRRTSSLALVAASVVVLLGAGGFALAYLLPNANTPEDAVRDLVDAVSDQDVLGAMDALVPSERRLVKDTVVDVVEELRRLEVVGRDADLSGIEGVDIEVDDLQLSSQPMGDGISLVTARGSARLSVEPSKLPTGSFVDEQAEGALGDESFSSSSPLDLQLVAVEEGGRWYVSALYSLADALRRDEGLPPPDFGHGVRPAGAASPEAAVRSMVDAGVALDARRAIALLDPDEAGALQDYAPLFLDDLESSAAETRGSLSVEVRSLDLSVDRDGSTADVTLGGFDVVVTADGERGSFAFDGRCITLTAQDEEPERQCIGEQGLAGLALPFAGGASFVDDDDDEQATAASGGKALSLSVVTVERDGRWYVSPIRSVLRPLVDALRALDRDDLDSFFEGLSGTGGGWSAAPLDAESTRSDLRNALTAFKVGALDEGAWPTDPAVVAEIEPMLQFQRYERVVLPGVVHFEVDGTVLRLAARGEDGCSYLSDDGSTISYATDPGCGPPSSQAYGPSW